MSSQPILPSHRRTTLGPIDPNQMMMQPMGQRGSTMKMKNSSQGSNSWQDNHLTSKPMRVMKGNTNGGTTTNTTNTTTNTGTTTTNTTNAASASRRSTISARYSISSNFHIRDPRISIYGALPGSMKESGKNHHHHEKNANKKNSTFLKDNKLQKRMRVDIIRFLKKYQYHHIPKAKELMVPTTSLVLNIVEFLIQKVDEKFELPKIKVQLKKYRKETNYRPSFGGGAFGQQLRAHAKTEIDRKFLSDFFQLMEYPYVFNESYLKTIGAAHISPYIFGAIHWFINLIEHFHAIVEAGWNHFDDGRTVFFSYLANAYECFMNDRDEDAKMLFQQNKERYENEVGELQDEVKRLEAECASTTKELEDYRNQPSKSQQLVLERDSIESSLEDAKHQLEQVQHEDRMVSNSLAITEKYKKELEGEMEEKNKLCIELQEKMSKQGITPTQIQLMQQEMIELENQVADQRKRLETNEREFESISNDIAHEKNNLYSVMEEYNMLVKEIPEFAKEIDFNPSSSTASSHQDIVNQDLNDILANDLTQLSQRLKVTMEHNEGEILNRRRQIERRMHDNQDLERKLEKAETSKKQFESVHATAFSQQGEARAQLQGLQQSIEHEFVELTEQLNASRLQEESLKKQLLAAQNAYSALEQTAQEEETMVYEVFIKTMEKLQRDKEKMEGYTSNVLQQSKDTLGQLYQ